MYREKEHNTIYRFLMEPKLRWGRHLVLILSVGIILANHLHITYEEQTEGINIYWIITPYLLVFLTILYLNLYLFIPRLLLREKYVEYILVLSGTTLLLSLGDFYAEYGIHKYYDLPFGQYSFFSSGRNKWVDLCSNFIIFTLYLVSVSVVIFYKNRIIDSERVERLRTEQVRVELDNLKNRISSDFLLSKLHKAAELCKTSPSKSSRILLQLSRILRYRLYDCNRESVLLHSEIKFLNDYLELEKNCNHNLYFKIVMPEKLPICLIPPLLLISIVEDSIKSVSNREDAARIHIESSIRDNILTFVCADNRKMIAASESVENYSTISQRLTLLQNQKYELNTMTDKELKQYKVILQYEI